MTKRMHILCAGAQEKIAAAVAQAEAQTSGEIVVVVAPQSDDYSGARWRLTLAGGVLASIVLLFVPLPFVQQPVYGVLLLQSIGLGLGYALSYLKPLLRLFVGRDVLTEEVHQQTLQAFFENNLTQTRDRTGVLLFISLMERRVEVLADTGINAKVSPGTWENIVADLVAEIRAGKITDGLCSAVTRCGALLTEHFPRRSDDANELPNTPIFEQ